MIWSFYESKCGSLVHVVQVERDRIQRELIQWLGGLRLNIHQENINFLNWTWGDLNHLPAKNISRPFFPGQIKASRFLDSLLGVS